MIARLLTIAALFAAGTAHAQIAPPILDMPEITVATSAEIAPTLRLLAAAFAKQEPGVPLRILAPGSDVAMAHLYTGRADVAVIGRDAFDPEAKAYEWVYRVPPKATPVMRGSAMTPNHSPTLTVRVNDANPLRAMPLSDLKAMLRVGGKGDLILPDAESGTGRYLRKLLYGGAPQFEWRRVREVADEAVAAAVARDPWALGFGDARPYQGTHLVKIIGDDGAEVTFDRTVIAYASPKARDGAERFVAFLRTPAAQAIVARGPYQALP